MLNNLKDCSSAPFINEAALFVKPDVLINALTYFSN